MLKMTLITANSEWSLKALKLRETILRHIWKHVEKSAYINNLFASSHARQRKLYFKQYGIVSRKSIKMLLRR